MRLTRRAALGILATSPALASNAFAQTWWSAAKCRSRWTVSAPVPSGTAG